MLSLLDTLKQFEKQRRTKQALIKALRERDEHSALESINDMLECNATLDFCFADSEKGSVAEETPLMATIDFCLRHKQECRAQKTTPLIAAIQLGMSAVVDRLLENGASPVYAAESTVFTLKNYELTPLFAAIRAQRPDIVARLLQRDGVDCQVQTKSLGTTPLMYAAIVGDAGSIDRLLHHGATIDAVSNDGNTAMMLAAQAGRVDVVERLLAAGASPRVVNNDGDTAVTLAARAGHVAVVEALLTTVGADEATQHRYYNETLIGVVANSDDVEALKRLHEKGADLTFRHEFFVNVYDGYLVAPLVIALIKQRTQCVNYLLNYFLSQPGGCAYILGHLLLLQQANQADAWREGASLARALTQVYLSGKSEKGRAAIEEACQLLSGSLEGAPSPNAIDDAFIDLIQLDDEVMRKLCLPFREDVAGYILRRANGRDTVLLQQALQEGTALNKFFKVRYDFSTGEKFLQQFAQVLSSIPGGSGDTTEHSKVGSKVGGGVIYNTLTTMLSTGPTGKAGGVVTKEMVEVEAEEVVEAAAEEAAVAEAAEATVEEAAAGATVSDSDDDESLITGMRFFAKVIAEAEAEAEAEAAKVALERQFDRGVGSRGSLPITVPKLPGDAEDETSVRSAGKTPMLS